MITGIKELRQITNLSQKEFGKKYKIPLKTIQNWESNTEKSSSRSCPPYVTFLLAKVIVNEYPGTQMNDKLDNLMIQGKINLEPRRESALRYAIDKICKSALLPYVEDLILYGSTARNAAKENSDIDLLLVLNPNIKKEADYSSWIIKIKGEISTEDYKDPETDLHIAYGDSWKYDNQAFQKNIQTEGYSIWN